MVTSPRLPAGEGTLGRKELSWRCILTFKMKNPQAQESKPCCPSHLAQGPFLQPPLSECWTKEDQVYIWGVSMPGANTTKTLVLGRNQGSGTTQTTTWERSDPFLAPRKVSRPWGWYWWDPLPDRRPCSAESPLVVVVIIFAVGPEDEVRSSATWKGVISHKAF